MVSIIIPSYNHEKYIQRCIDSVLNQTYSDWELIIIDDGSSDSSNELIGLYTDTRIKHVMQENGGAHNAINRGLSLAQGEYLTILNSDDEYHAQRLEKCIRYFSVNADIDLISTWIDVVDAESRKLGTKQAWHNMEPWEIKNKQKTFASTEDYALNALMSNFVSTTSNMIFKRSVYEKVGGMRNLRFTHDWDFLLRVCSDHHCYNLSEPLLNYRIHNTNTISSNRKWMLFEICWIIAANIDRFSKMLLPSLKAEDFIQSTIKILESFNLQNNDKVFWLLYWQITNLKHMGVANPEELYLNDADIRNSIIAYIQE
ncbi:MAG: glycosyltransferase [Sulfuricurvum sp.]|uniref:glycosyltransferase n=1 Tax=Sulfuricurvum sp. TaxID=2025608 RepID=UPI0026173349|nr:glycosyltransferase [Sulfuricurvum sp.]MDD3597278.1 glycosyltransferase [Sulfuricurvum sp.]MDD4883476.1 glycosyltransferase [Sulfuricurvum sp.]